MTAPFDALRRWLAAYAKWTAALFVKPHPYPFYRDWMAVNSDVRKATGLWCQMTPQQRARVSSFQGPKSWKPGA